MNFAESVGQQITEGGITAGLFVPGLHKHYHEIAPGNGLICTTTEDSVVIRPAEVPKDQQFGRPVFSAALFTPYHTMRLLSMRIRNRTYDPVLEQSGELDPRFYPGSKLIAAVIAYFEEQQQHPITHWDAVWEGYPPGYSDNYMQYKAQLAEIEGDITPQDRVDAAFKTWTGKQAIKYGFTEALSVREVDQKIMVRFARPATS